MPPASVATDMSVDEPVVSGAAKALDESTNSPQNVAAPMDEDGAPVPTTGSADGHDENDGASGGTVQMDLISGPARSAPSSLIGTGMLAGLIHLIDWPGYLVPLKSAKVLAFGADEIARRCSFWCRQMRKGAKRCRKMLKFKKTFSGCKGVFNDVTRSLLVLADAVIVRELQGCRDLVSQSTIAASAVTIEALH